MPSNNNIFKDRSCLSDMRYVAKAFGNYLYELLEDYHPNYVVPLESKGAVVLDLAMESSGHKLPSNCSVVYKRAFDFLSSGKLAGTKCLVIDDMFYSGRTMRKAYETLKNRGVSEIKLCTLFDFSYLCEEKDIDKEIYNQLNIPVLPQELTTLSHESILAYIQGEVLSERMPATHDHLIFEASNLDVEQYDLLLREISKTNRLLYYGRRGEYQTASILLDDVVEGGWSTLPKIRLWYNETKELLRFAPIAFPSCDYEPPTNHLNDKLSRIIVSSHDAAKSRDSVDIISLSQRMNLVRYLKPFLRKFDIKTHIDGNHLRRYYPHNVGDTLIELFKSEFEKYEDLSLPRRNSADEVIEYYSAVPDVLRILRNAYESQIKKGIPRKDCENKGYSVAELIQKLNRYSTEQIHSAIDYCFDTILTTAFWRKSNERAKPERALRTTENGWYLQFLPAETFGVAVLYGSELVKHPIWLPNKIYSILEHGLNTRLESLMTVMGYHGDYTKVKASEMAPRIWSRFPSSFWTLKHSGKEEYNEQKVYMIPKELKKDDAARLITCDPRLTPYQSKLDAVLHLCMTGGYKSSVLLDILCDNYGGTSYLAFNLQNLLEWSILAFYHNDSSAKKDYAQHKKGLETKLDAISNADNYLENMRRKATQLRYQTKIIAEEFLRKTKPLPQPNAIYLIAKTFHDHIEDLSTKIKAQDIKGIINAYNNLGSHMVNQNIDLEQNLRVGNRRVLKWIYAMCGKPQERTQNEILQLSEPQNMYVLAYDLTKEREKIAKQFGVKKSFVNRLWHGLIENWLVAYGGKLSKTSENKGDLRYGFFYDESSAVNAALWIDYHVSLLKGVNPFFPASKVVAGIGIGEGIVEPDSRGDVQGEILDTLGHELKSDKDYDKLVELLDDLAGKIGGREGRPPMWTIDPRKFPVTISKKIIGKKKTFKDTSIAPLINCLTHNSLPWQT